MKETVDKLIQLHRINEGNVGAFYFIGDHIISNSIDVRDGDEYGGFVNYSSHWDLWRAFLREYPEYKSLDYDYFPRGRVVFDRSKNKYIIYLDDKLKYDDYIDAIRSHYNLQSGSYILGQDEHYTSVQPIEDIDPDEIEDDVIFNESLDHYINRETY